MTPGTKVRLRVGDWRGNAYLPNALTVEGVVTGAPRPGVAGNVMVECLAPAKGGGRRRFIFERTTDEIEEV
jgi:hypothetical protein